jgi:glutamate formiminotransferase
MPVIAVPNVSEGRDLALLERLSDAVARSGCSVLDLHSDPVHNRSVFTVAGEEAQLIEGMSELACATRALDLTAHEGTHPRLGVLDVCPFVAYKAETDEAILVARTTGSRIGSRCELPVYLYGYAGRRELPELRRGGLASLTERAVDDPPDFGPRSIDPRFGVVCVGARGVLIAFNVWIAADERLARDVASSLRTSGGGPPGIRSLGLRINDETSQISMNLIDPAVTGIDRAFEATKQLVEQRGGRVIATEIVGLPPERFMPSPEKETARLLMKPGRSLESAL